MSFMWSIYKTVNEMEPITLLEKQLDMWERSLKKSKQSFLEGDISKETHEMHVINLTPKIELYNKAIDVLKEHLK